MEKARDYSQYQWKYGQRPTKSKARGKGKLVAKKITDKRGHTKTVWVSPFGDKLNYNYRRGHKYQDKEGNTIKVIGMDNKGLIVSTEVKKKGKRIKKGPTKFGTQTPK